MQGIACGSVLAYRELYMTVVDGRHSGAKRLALPQYGKNGAGWGEMPVEVIAERARKLLR